MTIIPRSEEPEMSETRVLRDHVMLVDGPLEGRQFRLDRTPRGPLDFHAAVGPAGRVLAVEGEPAPVGQPFRRVEYRYAPVLAPDGAASRADDGFLRFYYLTPGSDPIIEETR